MWSVVYKAVTLYDSVHSASVVGVIYRLQYTLYGIDVMYKFSSPFIFNPLQSESIRWEILDVNNS